MNETRCLPYDVLDHRLRGRWARIFRRFFQLSREAESAGDADAAQRFRMLSHQFRPLAFRSQPQGAAVVLDSRLIGIRRQLHEPDSLDLDQLEQEVAKLKVEFGLPV